MNSTLLAQLNQVGQEAMNSKNYQLAIECFQKIVKIQPNYEHGMCFYNLAHCYQELGDREQAKIHYEKALSYMPEDTIYLGGYGSFLCLIGNFEQAFSIYLKILKFKYRHAMDIENTLKGLNYIGQKLDWDKEIIDKKINDILKQRLIK